MAGAVVVSPILKLVIGKLGSDFWEELELLWGMNNDIEKLRSVLSTIQDVLDDAEKRSVGDRALRNWLRKLKDAAFDADDVMDEFQTEAMRRRMMESQYHLLGKVRDFFSANNQFVFRFKMVHKIEDVLERLDGIAEERKKFHLTGGSVSERIEDRQTYSAVNESEVYGRDEDKEKVVNFLLNIDNDKDVSVLPIVGLGGVGKTTLAQLVYNDERIKRQFDLRIWVCISENFDVKGVTRAIIECATKNKCDLLQIEPMQQLLQETLSGKRLLLILDDVWNEDGVEWERLKSLLRGGQQGSKILVTTRSRSVARIMGSILPHQLKGLSTEDCWIIFKQRAFGLEREEETPRLVEIGKEIVGKCGGLPLAAKALGSLMRSKRGEAEWLDIKRSEIWRLPDEDTKILPVLRLSYNYLPSHLKQCFVYCSLFPKDYMFDKEKLIGLWIAEGFIPSSDEGLHAEDIGNQYFNSLLWRSFFQDVGKDNYSNKVTCKMHDLVHDLACYVAGDEFAIMETRRESTNTHECHYLSVICDSMSSNILNPSCVTKKLRSLILLVQDKYSTCNIKEINWDILIRLRHLRVLDLSCSKISVLPATICRLKHLRFLDLSRTMIETIPNTITSLQNLSTLNLELCYQLRELPRGMSSLSNLRHLDIYGCSSMTRMPHGMGRLSNLRTLSMFIVGEEDGHTIKELQHANLIRGRLQIRNLQNVKNPMEAQEANLKAKINVRQLELYWERDEENATMVFESLQPHTDLEELNIKGYGGTRFPSWMYSTADSSSSSSSSFKNLVSIELWNLQRCGCLPPLGHLPSLKCLYIHKMDAVRRIGEEFYGKVGRFALLEDLSLHDMPNLEEWLVEVVEIEREMMFPCLTSLVIIGCPKLVVKPGLPVSVVNLFIIHSNEELLSAGSVAGLYRLREICISNCSASSLSSWWEGLKYLTVLEKLQIENFEELTCLPDGIIQHHLPSLRTLEISWNSNMRSLVEAEGDGAGGQQQPPLFFTSLRHLKITGCRALTALPEWLGGLTSLLSLELSICHKLAMLPDGLQHLTALHQLTVHWSPLLGRRCKRETGEDWHKIAHIPCIQIFPTPQESEEEETENSTRRRRGYASNNFIRRLGPANCLRSNPAED